MNVEIKINGKKATQQKLQREDNLKNDPNLESEKTFASMIQEPDALKVDESTFSMQMNEVGPHCSYYTLKSI